MYKQYEFLVNLLEQYGAADQYPEDWHATE